MIVGTESLDAKNVFFFVFTQRLGRDHSDCNYTDNIILTLRQKDWPKQPTSRPSGG